MLLLLDQEVKLTLMCAELGAFEAKHLVEYLLIELCLVIDLLALRSITSIPLLLLASGMQT